MQLSNCHGIFGQRSCVEENFGFGLRYASRYYLKRAGRAYTCIPGNVAVEFCVWKLIKDKRISGMGYECSDRNIIRPEKFQ